MIPKILHFIWLGSDLPKEENNNIESWSIHNPDFKIMIWNESNLLNLDMSDSSIKAINLCQGLYAHQADIIRYHAVYKYGGFYIDTDIKCHKAIPDSFLQFKIITLKPQDKSNWVTNAFFGACKKNALLRLLIKNITPISSCSVKERKCYPFGPVFLTKMLCIFLKKTKHDDILSFSNDTVHVLDNKFWCPKNTNRYCTHFFNYSWCK